MGVPPPPPPPEGHTRKRNRHVNTSLGHMVEERASNVELKQGFGDQTAAPLTDTSRWQIKQSLHTESRVCEDSCVLSHGRCWS